MGKLKEALTAPGKREVVIKDCVDLIESEVSAKKGMGGMAIKGGYGVVKKVKPGIIPEAVDNLLDDFATRLEPFYEQYVADGDGGGVEPYFVGRDTEIANALLGVTDARAQNSRHATIKKAYEKLRPMGVKHTAAAVPGIARLVSKHT